MKILVIGTESDLLECRQKFGDKHDYLFEHNPQVLGIHLATTDVVFDFLIEEHSPWIEMYTKVPRIKAFLNTSKTSLRKLMLGQTSGGCFFGFAGLPTFVKRELLEVCLHNNGHMQELEEVCQQLGTAFQVVADKVGMITPRVICMIINEAYFTTEEGTASRQDIDMAMKLGTNYPWGPFDWCKRIGIRNVYELLEAVYQDTGDERYKICPLLRKEYLDE